MKNDLFEQAKQAVAEKHKYQNFSDLVILGGGLPTEYYEEAAELYAQWRANEAVKAEEFDAKQMPDYDGRFLGFIVQKQECGTIWKYWRVVFCEFNIWKLEPAERIICWRNLPPEPKGNLKLLEPIPPKPDER